jgi:transposase
MSVKNFLSPDQKKRLQKALKNNICPHFREHVLIYLLLNEGKTQNEISQFIGCSVRSVAYWSAYGDPDNLDSFRDKREQGNHQKATAEYIKLLLETIDTTPSVFGYEFGRWTTQRLSTHLYEKTKIVLSSSQIRRILKKKNIATSWQNIA